MLEYALKKAREHHSGGQQRLYAVAIDKRGNIIAEGGNLYTKTHPLMKKYSKDENKCSLHAEVNCVAQLARSNKKCYAIYVARAKRDGKSGLAKPCPICEMVLREAKIEHIFYTI